MAVMEDTPHPKTIIATRASGYDPIATATTNSSCPIIVNPINTMTIIFIDFVLSNIRPTIMGTKVDGREDAEKSIPKPAGEIKLSLIRYNPNTAKEFLAK